MVKSSFDKVRRCRSSNSLKMRLFAEHYLMNVLIIAVLILVNGELTKVAVNYNTETKTYQFKPEM